jgi:hypothetical protein
VGEWDGKYSSGGVFKMAERRKKVGKCKCKKEVKDGEKGMMCEGCEGWFHLKCIGMKEEIYRELEKKEEEGDGEGAGLKWYCEVCSVEVGRMPVRIRELEERNKKLEIEVQRISKKLEDLLKREREAKEERENDKGKQGKIDKEVGEVKRSVEELRAKVAEKGEVVVVQDEIKEVRLSFAEMVKKEEMRKEEEDRKEKESKTNNQERKEKSMMLEMIDRDKRRNNVIIFGVPEEGENGEGTEIVEEVISGLLGGGEKYEVVGRIGKKGSRPRPIRVKVEEFRNKRRLLIAAKKLKDMDGKRNIYIVQDLTMKQQEEDWKMREEARKNRINRGAERVNDGSGESGNVEVGVNREVEGKN